MRPAALVPRLNCFGMAVLSALMIAWVTLICEMYVARLVLYSALASLVSAAVSPSVRCGPGLLALVQVVGDLRAYSAGCSAMPRYPHSSDCPDWIDCSFSNKSLSRALILLCVGRGWRDGSVPIRSRAFSYEISYAGSAAGKAASTAAAAAATAGSAAAAAAARAAAAAAAGSAMLLCSV